MTESTKSPSRAKRCKTKNIKATKQISLFIKLLQEVEVALLNPSDNCLKKFALFETYKPFVGNDPIMLVADTLLARTNVFVSAGHTGSYLECARGILADSVRAVRGLFQQGTTEEQLMAWLDDLAKKNVQHVLDGEERTMKRASKPAMRCTELIETCRHCSGTGSVPHDCSREHIKLVEVLYKSEGAFFGDTTCVFVCLTCGQLWKIESQYCQGTGSDETWLRPGDKEKYHEFPVAEAKKYMRKAESLLKGASNG